MRRQFAFFLAALALIVVVPAFSQESAPAPEAPAAPAHAGETVIVPEAPPPPSTNWPALVAIGAGFVFAGVELAKKNVPSLKGWYVWLSVVPITAAVAVYQVGFSDPKLLAKHAGIILLAVVGSRAAAYKVGAKIAGALVALVRGDTIPPAPPFGSDPPPPSAGS